MHLNERFLQTVAGCDQDFQGGIDTGSMLDKPLERLTQQQCLLTILLTGFSFMCLLQAPSGFVDRIGDAGQPALMAGGFVVQGIKLLGSFRVACMRGEGHFAPQGGALFLLRDQIGAL